MDNVDEGILAIAHHDDLQYVENENVVCPSQNRGIYTRNGRVMRASRKPWTRMQYRNIYLENKCPCSLRMAVRLLLFPDCRR
jgi:hypothetical protein